MSLRDYQKIFIDHVLKNRVYMLDRKTKEFYRMI